jgi:hypothetical protein
VRVVVGEETLKGRAVTVERGLEPRTVAQAVRTEGAVGDGTVAVESPEPGPVHGYVGRVEAGMGVRTKTALAAAARSRGHAAPQDEAIASVEAELAALSVEPVTTADQRAAVAETRRETERLRERVAAARGRLDAAREGTGGEASAASEALTDAVGDLADVETAAAAASERLDRRRERARQRRDRLERRFALEDRLGNLEREARRHLVETVEPAFARALAALPAETAGDPLDADPVPAALATARVADLAAPVVVADGPFESAERVREWLDAPVIYIR